MLLHAVSERKSLSRPFHTSAPRHLHPAIWAFYKPVLKGVAWATGRTTRKWYRELPPEKRSVLEQHLIRQRYKYIGIFGTLGAAAAIHYYTHLQTAPITGRRRYMIMNMEQLKILSEMEKESIGRKYANIMLPETSKQTQLVASVVQRIIGANMDIPEIKTIKWSVRVVDADMKNAFVLPSGDIYMSRGLLELITNEDQLGIILGHELSHAILAHTGEKFSYLQMIDAMDLAFFIWAVLPSDMTAAIVNYLFEIFVEVSSRLPYSRQLEQEADEVGLTLAAKACFDVREAVILWRSIGMRAAEADVPEFRATHPANETRAKNLDEKLPAALELRRQCHCQPLPEGRTVDILHLEKNLNKLMAPLAKQMLSTPNIANVGSNNDA